MNLTFWRNIFSILFLVAFALDIIFGNGIRWGDWICGAAFFGSVNNLLSTFEEYVGKRKIYKMDETFWMNVTSVLVIGSFIFSLIFGENLWTWNDWLSGVACAYCVRSLWSTLVKRSRK